MYTLGIILLLVLAIFLNPMLSFFFGWLAGWVIRLTIGHLFIAGLAVLGLDITLAQIPLMCGALGVIASFFKSTPIGNKDKKD